MINKRRKTIYNKVWAGDYYQNVLVLQKLYYPRTHDYGAIFRCHCGNTFQRKFHNVKRGQVSCSSCSSYERKKSKFVIKDRRLYCIWKSMNRRCHNPEDPNYHHYGGRGIKVCEDWRDTSKEGFNNFYNQLGMYPTTQHTVDRLDVDGDYCIDNCSWKTQKEQMNNTRRNHVLKWKGVEYTLQQLGEELGIKPNTLLTRLRRGYPLEEAIKQKPAVRRFIKDSENLLVEKGEYTGSLKGSLEDISIMADKGVTVRDIAKIIGGSEYIISRILHKYLKKEPYHYLTTYTGKQVRVKNTYTFSQEDLNIIFKEKDKGVTNTSLAKKFKCSNSTITNVLRRFYDKN